MKGGGAYINIGSSSSSINSSGSGSGSKMTLGKSVKMYLTIFIATTCIYMVLYQYHMSREPFSPSEVGKHQEKSSSSSYIASYLWSPISLLMANNLTSNNATTTTTTTVATTTVSNVDQVQESSFGSIQSVSLAATRPTLTSSSASASASGGGAHKTATTTSTTPAPATIGSAVTATTRSTKANPSAKKATANAAKALAPSTSMSQSQLDAAHKIQPTFVAASQPPPLYIITPTYRRPEQLAELTRLGYTLKHVANLLWLVIEDANKTNPLVAHTLDRIGVPYEYMVAPMPEKYKQTKKAKPRGVSNRNRGLEYLRQHATEGVLYFADDDNTYDISIFEQMRYISKVGMWPVGLVTKTGVSSPIIRNGKLDGYYDGWIGGRKYPVDMAGFAVNIKFLRQRPHAQMPFKPGYEEDGFLRSLAPLDNNEIDLLADECRDILTWHTQTKKNPPAQALNKTRYSNTNLVHIDKLLVRP
ncbi:galactosylgalactosylxylosylprotein 3-beta-glucuronosyltransferase P isoform X1 [Drosophila obscura]|uniref:galactosylgalactosylxylosylprotein 3-beta-glucuronosyltransferase P isoform X1 n=1 Tax=Drosophila obscura TaxID=7282 RepID=UPI001BB25DF5|nr:galactosylgalactosylxylosylprotein 3-beta-glucuronosyltransferase P isoform X1 [Drosophila obscura]XP_022220358.2 galactosylgalactosylxylosylprotein 3-beta-glucuronosyltransferase P isoform X1 [Drosophila obscura]XP_022220361.2 galactosylgalactosylxylosylprotein 3-beta-glucuronosyltransferase P isoform X1 [Drosophila obscura]XP_022220362.2 galactosylgalactosylxylosylprotein 3-beta-glucuronosyltransferase P isoform X1 [Drosophila obscura]